MKYYIPSKLICNKFGIWSLLNISLHLLNNFNSFAATSIFWTKLLLFLYNKLINWSNPSSLRQLSLNKTVWKYGHVSHVILLNIASIPSTLIWLWLKFNCCKWYNFLFSNGSPRLNTPLSSK